MEGWIKLHRKLWEDELWEDESEPHNKRSAWIDLLMMVNHEDKEILFDGQLITVKRGQRLTSIRKLAQRWGWSKDRTLNYLKLLEASGKIIRETDSRRTLITVVKYSVYQGDQDSNKDTDKDSKPTVDRHQQGHQLATNKNDIRMIKNEKNEEEGYGTHHHVHIDIIDYLGIVDKYGEVAVHKYIKRLDEWIEQHGDHFPDHRKTLEQWIHEGNRPNFTERRKYES